MDVWVELAGRLHMSVGSSLGMIHFDIRHDTFRRVAQCQWVACGCLRSVRG